MPILLKRDSVVVSQYLPEFIGMDIAIGIDSSKSNTAMIVGDPYGNILSDFEISGAGEDVDVYDLCKVTRDNLKSLFEGANIMAIGIEDIITKKEKGKENRGYAGIDIHTSRAKITAVFNNFIFFFEDYYHMRPDRINNWAWKSAILPEAYRTRDHDKGARDWYRDRGLPYGSRKDDVADAACIYQYIVQQKKFKPIVRVYNIEPKTVNYDFYIVPQNFISPGCIEFKCDNNCGYIDNMNTIANKLKPDEVGIMQWPLDRLEIEDIYNATLQCVAGSRFNRIDTNVYLLVYRKE